ncbi:hypothetical protein NUACC26_063500 [Scytonema sp. NUACC26]
MEIPKEELELFVEYVTKTAPLGRLGTPEEIANAVVYLFAYNALLVTLMSSLFLHYR